MKTAFRVILAFATGAVAMYCLDPAAGRRRRAWARDQGTSARRKIKHYAGARSKRAGHRVKGLLAKTRTRLARAPVDDEILQARIRSKLGHVLEHPGALDVEVSDGHVTLAGSAPVSELDSAMEAVSAMPGVESVDHRPSRRSRAGNAGETAAAGQATQH